MMTTYSFIPATSTEGCTHEQPENTIIYCYECTEGCTHGHP